MKRDVDNRYKQLTQLKYNKLCERLYDLIATKPASYFESDKNGIALLNEISRLHDELVNDNKQKSKKLTSKQMLAFIKREDKQAEKYYDELEREQFGNQELWLNTRNDYDIIDGGWYPDYYYDSNGEFHFSSNDLEMYGAEYLGNNIVPNGFHLYKD
ncbi:MAG: hypothetical protein SOX63_02425 [Eubacteriales bacterium]|nr:hypothetical protein [Eubacteriales bacterium]